MPIIANIMRKSRQTISTLVIAGIEDRRAFTTSLKPSFLPITLKGRSALRTLKAFRDFKAPPEELPLIKTIRSIIDATTTMKSSIFQADLI